ncbi:MAG: alpha/beta hydrolase fold domain-containing protein, partial [Peptococcaceae bacterium]|nr:alpha/beta hydrolase fold domain-containing protein [Peptococcaceae bacterium]
KMDDFPDEDVVCEDIEEQLDNAYVNRKGVPLAMDIFKPKVDEYTELPVIVVIHGGGLVMGDRKISRKFSRMLAQKGYLVFSIEYRLVPRANVCEQLDDVCAGMDLIGRKLVDYNVDFTRMFLVSESAGAYLATYVAAMKHSEKLQNAIGYQPTRMTFKAMGLLSGMFYTNRPDPIGLLLAEQFYGEKGNDGTFLQYTDPEHPEIVSNLPPAFFITSRGDFLNRYSIDYHKALKKAGKEAYLLYYGSQELTHSFPTMTPDRAESEEAIDKMLAWFEEQAANHERMIKMKKDKTDNTAQLMARIESGEITDQKMWSYIKELNSASEERLNAVAMISGGREYTYRQMFRMWDRYAEVFSALGINEINQSRAAVIGIASPELMSTFYALNMTGASISLYPSSLVFIQERFEQMFVTEHITDLIISSAIANPALLNQLFANKEKLGLRHIIVLRDNEAGLAKGSMEKMAIHMAYQQIKNMPGVVFMHDLLTKYEATPITYGTAASKEAALIVHTSGTTKGINKPIPHTDKGVNSAVNSFLTNPLFTGFAGKRTIMSGDMSGAYMIINQVHLPLTMGCPIVLAPSFGTQFQD